MILLRSQELTLIRAGLELLAEQKFDEIGRPRPRALDALLAEVGDAWRRQVATSVAAGAEVADAGLMTGPAALTLDETATCVRMSRRQLEREIDAGHLKVVRVGRSVRVRPSSIEDWLAAGEGDRGSAA